MYFIVYKTTNLINGKYYIGHHRSKVLNDIYLGSGAALICAIKKYGKQNFARENLFVFSDEDTMLLCEVELIDYHIDDRQCYNMKRGGKGGWDFVNAMNLQNCMKNTETVKKVIETSRKNGSYVTPKRLEHLKKIAEISAEKTKGKARPEHSLYMKENYDKIYNKPEVKEKVKNSMSDTYKIETPDGTVIVTNRLGEFCKQNGIGFNALWSIAKYNKQKKQGKLKGWKVSYVKDKNEFE